ncbi:MFS transporter [Streptomyces spinoverrucosus]|uniref:MFS transporter n=1 Tax=Streptomyces spinoverrucosus TaxID=284043 RepID=A0A4Y3VNP3_9ACTN|nr:MFS transporter [Streptomyces spinoverrucosus]GEC07300.1 MFS transporter [Streptomyces spinoverrucosus]GHB55554.1 MFS transporter [Streptomyces spinoverrucosus]
MSLQDRTQAVPRAAAPPQKDGKLGLALLVIAAAQLMLVLDNTIVAVALPSMQSALGLSEAGLGWVVTAYALAFGGLLLAGGRAGDLFGRRLVFRTGLVIFTAASLLGGLATTGGLLITARLLQGLGAAIAAPTALSLLATTFPAGPARNKALGVYGAMGGLGSVVGLLLGGALTEYLNWRWVMFVNIPIALAVLVGTGVLVEGGRERGKVDVPGALTATFGFGALVYGITRAGEEGLDDTTTLISLGVALVLLVAFVVIQRTARAPMIPGGVLADKGRVGANLVMFLVGAGMLATFYFLTLYMQVVKGYDPMVTGVAYLPYAVGMLLAAGALGPQLLARLSERTVISVGLTVGVLGMVWFSLLAPGQNPWVALLPAQLVSGLGLGMVFVAVTIISVRGVAPQETGAASGLVNTAQQIGGAIGLAALAAAATVITQNESEPTSSDALTTGYSYGFLLGGGLYLLALVTALITAPKSAPQPQQDGAQSPAAL